MAVEIAYLQYVDIYRQYIDMMEHKFNWLHISGDGPDMSFLSASRNGRGLR